MGALGTFKAAILLVAGIALGWLGSGLYAEFFTLPAAREAGAQSERLVQEEQRRRAEAQAAAVRQTAQAAIDAVEREYHQRDQARALQVDALERALEQEQANVPVPSAADRGACACRPAIPRRVRDALDAAGRAAPTRPPSAKPDAALR